MLRSMPARNASGPAALTGKLTEIIGPLGRLPELLCLVGPTQRSMIFMRRVLQLLPGYKTTFVAG